MKLQIEGQHLRVRIDESELTRLLAGETVNAQTRFAHAFSVGFALRLVDAKKADFSGRSDCWKIDLPDTAVRKHAERLPTREGLRFMLTGDSVEDGLTLLFDVDVRDSVRRRKSS